MTIADLKTGQSGIVTTVEGERMLRGHVLDMGLIPGTSVKKTGSAPLGDPIELLVRGYSLSLRLSEAALINLKCCEEEGRDERDEREGPAHKCFPHNKTEHPGLGEGGKYHTHEDSRNELPKNTVLTFALAGQQNCGKTTVFNRLTGSNQHVGNFPGVTVDRKDGHIKGYPLSVVTDLPGIYSLSPYTAEELVSRKFILEERPHCIINVVDANNITRNLYLTMQLMNLSIPMVLALNMMDEVIGNGGVVLVNEMEQILGIPVIPIAAARNEGMDELVKHAIHVAKYQEKPARQDFCDPEEYGGAVHRCLHGIKHLIEDHAVAAGIPPHFAAEKIVEGDLPLAEALKLDTNEKEMIEHIIVQMEEERGLDRKAAIADMRFSFIERLCRQTVVKPGVSREYIRSRRMDTLLTGRWTAIPIFISVMVSVLWLSIDVLGAPLQNLLNDGIQWLGTVVENALVKADVSPVVRFLVGDGFFSGVGSVVSFVPVIILMFFFLSILEDSGYMARVAFVTDKLLRRIGLSGRSIVPLLIGLGCSVPAVMATRTLPSANDRKKTVLLTPFMSCSAKLPIYAFFSASFFPGHGGLVLVCLYLLSITVGIFTALVGKHLGNRSEASPFIMELPNYRLPRLRNTFLLLWDKTKDFLQKAFTVIFLATIVIWFLQSFNFRFEMVENGEGSILAWLAGLIAPVFAPLGLGDWRVVTAFVSGFLAKESVVATMEILGVTSLLSISTAVSMLTFCLLYTPCIAAIASVRRELGKKWAAFMIVFQCLVAWVVAFAAYNITLLIV